MVESITTVQRESLERLDRHIDILKTYLKTQHAPKGVIEALEGLTVEQHKAWKFAAGRACNNPICVAATWDYNVAEWPMPHMLNPLLLLVGRVLAGMVAAMAFYLAFFLYEDEEGKWQNRLENVWIAVDERAKVTSSKSLALLNKLGETLRLLLRRVFGENLITMRGAWASLNLTGAGICLALSVGLGSNAELSGSLLSLLYLCFFVAGAALPAIYPGRWVTVVRYLPWLGLPIWLLVSYHGDVFSAATMSVLAALLLLVCLCINFFALFIISLLFDFIANSASVIRIASVIVALTVFSVLMIGSTLFGLAFIGPFVIANLTTIIYCLIPDLLLAVLLLHMLLWPTVSRLIYPLTRYRIVSNRKTLIAVGTLCTTFALHVEHVGIKEVLKLLS
jgi:hypothetical protein